MRPPSEDPTPSNSKKLAPRDLEAEFAILGAMLIDPLSITRAATAVEPEAFSDPAARDVFSAIVAIHREGGEPDRVSLRNYFAKQGRPDFPDYETLSQFIDATPTSANVEFHARIVRDLAARRMMAEAGAKMAAAAFDGAVEIGDLVSESVTSIVRVSAPSASRSLVYARDLYLDSLERTTDPKRVGDALDGPTTGNSLLDEMTGGFAPGRLIVVAARPGVGKTSWGLHAAKVVAQTGAGDVLFFSLEMSREELVARLISAEARVPLRRVGRRHLSDREIALLSGAAGRLHPLPIILDDASDTPQRIRLVVQHHQAVTRRRVALVVIDYLGLVRFPGKNDSKNDEISKITRFFKRDIAMALGVPVVALAQLNRDSVKEGKSRPPILSDLRDSGSIEQDANQVLMLHYDGPENGEGSSEKWGSALRTDGYLRKNRHGPGGLVEFYHERPTGFWSPLSHRDDGPPVDDEHEPT